MHTMSFSVIPTNRVHAYVLNTEIKEKAEQGSGHTPGC
jgi:hypothetical protein